jgi:hypothetical protein
MLLGALLFSGCSEARIGAMRSESQSVELGDVKSVRVDINMGAGNLSISGGAEKLLEANFNYNVARLKPEVEYRDGKLSVQQPDILGFPALQNITDYRNEWSLRLYDEVPMDLIVGVGAGTSDLQLADLSLTRIDIHLGAGTSTIDLRGDRKRDLDATINAGAANLIVRLPRDIGVRVEVDSGPHTIDAPGLTWDGDAYTNAAYGLSDVVLHAHIEAGIGSIILETD